MTEDIRNNKIHTSKLMTVIMIAAVFIYILTSSIAFPILCKPFYYAQIDNLQLEEYSGFNREQIETAYSEVIDYCIGARPDFAVGGLNYSESGKDHFKDCRKLFILDLGLFAGSLLILIGWIVLNRFTSIRCARPGGRGAGFWGGIGELVIFAILGGLGSINFDKTFVIFHSIFFPGKTNWIFDPNVDVVINILPEVFFMRCAIVIVALIILQSLIFIIAGRKKHQDKQFS